MRMVLLAALTLGGVGTLASAEDPSRLAGFPGVAQVVVVSAHPDLGEARLRAAVEGRLHKAGLLLESSPAAGGSLSIRVSGDHNSSVRGCAYTFYDLP
jgi:hypothetical protein